MDNNKDAQKYRGVAIDIADDDKCTENLVDKDVKELNNNPRNKDML